MKLDFHRQIVFLTGANGTIGRATAKLLGSLGASLFVTDISIDGLESCLLEHGVDRSRIAVRVLDVARSKDAEAAVDACAAQFGAIDILIANAGVFPRRAFRDITDEEWRHTFAINVDGVFYCCRAALPHMRAGGSIISLASIAAHSGARDHAHYAATKGALLSLMRSLAWELAPDVRVNCISPGPVGSPMVAELMQHRGKQILRQTPLNRLAAPDEIAKAIAFMSSSWASHITGSAMHVNGGLYIAG